MKTVPGCSFMVENAENPVVGVLLTQEYVATQLQLAYRVLMM